jgi:outer membrane protein TolC
MAFGSKLNQATITASDFNPEILNNPDRTTNFATKIEVLQPIINVDGLYGRQAARAKMNAFELRTERTKEYLELEVNKSFMELQLAYKAVGVLEKQVLPRRIGINKLFQTRYSSKNRFTIRSSSR